MRKCIYISLLLFLPSLILRGQSFGLSDALIAKTSTGGYALNLNSRVVGMSLNAPFVQMNIGTNNSQNFGLYQNNIQRILLSSTGSTFTGGLTWNSSVLDNVSTNALVLNGSGVFGYRPLSGVAFTGDYNALINKPTFAVSNLSNTTANGNNTPYSIVMDGYGDHGLYGTYDPSRPSTIFGMGTGFTLGNTPQSYGNFYGIARSFEPDYGAIGNNSQAKAGLGHQYLFMQNAVTGTAVGTGIWTSGNITSQANLNLSGSAFLNGNMEINTPIGNSGLSFRVGGVQRVFGRYNGIETSNNTATSGFEMFSYNNDGSYLGSMFMAYRNGDFNVTNDLRAKRLAVQGDNTSVYSGLAGNNYFDASVASNFRDYAGNQKLVVGTTQLTSYVPFSTNNNTITSGQIDLSGAGSANGLTNKLRFYNTGSVLEDETSNSYGIGMNNSTGRLSYSAGTTGYHSFSTQNIERLRVGFDGNIIAASNSYANSTVGVNPNLGYGSANLNVGNTTYGGFLQVLLPNTLRTLYIGFPSGINSPNVYSAEQGTWHRFQGGKVEVIAPFEGQTGNFTDYVNSATQFTGGIGAMTTAGTLDWNHVSNKKSGNGYSLLLGTATGGNGQAGYYHSFNFEYASKNGTGNFTRLAVPYNGTDLWIQSWYSGIGYSAWKTYIQSSKVQDVGSNDIVHSGNVNSYNNNASNLTLGTVADARLSTNVVLKGSANDYQGTNRFYGTTLLDGPIFFSTPNQSPIIATHKVMMQDASNQPNKVTQAELSSAFANLTQQAYQAVVTENGSYSIPNNAGYVVCSRSGTLTNTGIFTINLPTTPNSNTQEIEFTLPFLHAMIGFQLQFFQGAILARTISFGTSAQTGNNYAIYAPSNASFKIRYNSLTNLWYIVNIYNPN